MSTAHPVAVAGEKDTTMAFELKIIGPELPEDATLPGKGTALDQAAAAMRANPGQWIVVEEKDSINGARNLADAITKGGRAAFKTDNLDGLDKGGWYEGAYRATGTVIGKFTRADTGDRADGRADDYA